MERVVEQGADAGAGERGRVRVRALDGEVGGAIQVSLAQADLGKRLFGAERGGEVVQARCRVLGTERTRDPRHRAGVPARL